MTNPERPDQAESSAAADELRALSAFIDDEAPDAERAETAARIARDPASAATVAAYRAQDNALRALFAASADKEPQVVRRASAPALSDGGELAGRWVLRADS